MSELATALSQQQHGAFRADVLAGLAQSPKTLPSRWLYDDRGSELFEQITQLAEYYPTRTETSILRAGAAEMARFCGDRPIVLEYGAGAGIKTQILIEALAAPRLYVPVDIAGDFLDQTVTRLRDCFPNLLTRSIVADFTQPFELPAWIPSGRRVAFFPGSTIGNLNPSETATFLQRMRRHVGADGRAIIGVDLKKSLEVLLPAYDDASGVTALFNLNLLRRINRELGGNFAIEGFRHSARWNERESAIEMHLVSTRAQSVLVSGRKFEFDQAESIHTESSRKYDVEGFERVARENGWVVGARWIDDQHLFALFGLQ
ncbi:MAG TPA: L-histidine N(alpha)-methyltransferase [Steroidobacteraceae bacterium]|jgi:dimethylhistidine N-methyltransferase|nr:L-histidine N(alpha)-methyltransferase [Steroidobacteraceae bacterium]